MIRAATFRDIPEIETMIREMHEASKYRGRVSIKDKLMREMLMAMVAGQNQRGPGATFIRLAEKGDRVVGFMAGLLQPIYFIGDKLAAEDAFLHVRDGAGVGPALRLIDEYVAWAADNPKVIETKLSWADTLPGAERVADLYRRKGFHQIGEIYERRAECAERIAA